MQINKYNFRSENKLHQDKFRQFQREQLVSTMPYVVIVLIISLLIAVILRLAILFKIDTKKSETGDHTDLYKAIEIVFNTFLIYLSLTVFAISVIFMASRRWIWVSEGISVAMISAAFLSQIITNLTYRGQKARELNLLVLAHEFHIVS